ncbi:MAG: hypothetical protein V3V46_07760 [Anaerolineales bacterium]
MFPDSGIENVTILSHKMSRVDGKGDIQGDASRLDAPFCGGSDLLFYICCQDAQDIHYLVKAKTLR